MYAQVADHTQQYAQTSHSMGSTTLADQCIARLGA
jgi:hypothetical protein